MESRVKCLQSNICSKAIRATALLAISPSDYLPDPLALDVKEFAWQKDVATKTLLESQ